jgi:hypothetical protein
MLYTTNYGYIDQAKYPDLATAEKLEYNISRTMEYRRNPSNEYHSSYQTAVNRSSLFFGALGLFILSAILNGYVFTAALVAKAELCVLVGALLAAITVFCGYILVQLCAWDINGD